MADAGSMRMAQIAQRVGQYSRMSMSPNIHRGEREIIARN
jgi:hypothetical protein